MFDQIFPYTGPASQAYSSQLYTDGAQGRFGANYFLTNLQNRGLINSTLGPNLASFPFFEDGSVIYTSLRAFMTSFVSSYYTGDAAVKADAEIQAWVQEARGPAAARDFPTITSTADLVNVLTHIVSLFRNSKPRPRTHYFSRLIWYPSLITPSTPIKSLPSPLPYHSTH